MMEKQESSIQSTAEEELTGLTGPGMRHHISGAEEASADENEKEQPGRWDRNQKNAEKDR